MQMKNTFSAASRGEWREWLSRHHASEKEVWLVYFKPRSGKASITYQESLEEALCFGWIDSIIQKIDEESYARKFNPRRPGSQWSERNQRLVAQLVLSGRMTGAGMAKVDFPLPDAAVPRSTHAPIAVPDWLTQALAVNPAALEFFDSLPPSQKGYYIRWISDAKLEATRLRRIQEALVKLEAHVRLGMK